MEVISHTWQRTGWPKWLREGLGKDAEKGRKTLLSATALHLQVDFHLQLVLSPGPRPLGESNKCDSAMCKETAGESIRMLMEIDRRDVAFGHRYLISLPSLGDHLMLGT